MGKITEYPTVGSLKDNDKIFVNAEGHLRQIEKKDLNISGGGSNVIHTSTPTTTQLSNCVACDIVIHESKYDSNATMHLVNNGGNTFFTYYVNDASNYFIHNYKMSNGTITKDYVGKYGTTYNLEDLSYWSIVDYILYMA